MINGPVPDVPCTCTPIPFAGLRRDGRFCLRVQHESGCVQLDQWEVIDSVKCPECSGGAPFHLAVCSAYVDFNERNRS